MTKRIQIHRPSVASLMLLAECGGHRLPGNGTGFVAMAASGTPHLITNLHVVRGINPHTGTILSGSSAVPEVLVIRHNLAGRLGHWIDKSEPLYTDGVPLWKEHPTLGSRADFVALPLTNLGSIDLHPYVPSSPGPDIALGPADEVSVIGFPFGRASGGAFAIWATGFLASEPDTDYDNLPVQLIDCRTRPGQSGSPVVAFRNGGAFRTTNGDTALAVDPIERFIGVYSGRIDKESDIGMVWKASAVADLLAAL